MSIETIKEEAERRAEAGDGCIAGLLAIIREQENETERVSKELLRWKNGEIVYREPVWGYDG